MERLAPEKAGCFGELILCALFWTVLWPFFLLGLLLTPVINVVLTIRLRSDRKYEAFQNYQRAVLNLERKQRDFWYNLSPLEFEKEIARLYSRHGYRTTVTQASGDQGIDIIMYKGTEKTIVQCKRHRNPVGPAVVREPYGALHASYAHAGILVCVGGFTKGVVAFAQDKPITLLDIDGVLELEKKVA